MGHSREMRKNLMKKWTESSNHEVHEGHKVNPMSLLKKVFLVYFVTFVYFVVGAAIAGASKKDLTVAEITQKVEEAQAAMKDVQMELSMEMKDTLSGAQQNSRGLVKMKSPDKIYVHYTKPSEQYLYIGAKLVQMYQPDQKTVYQQQKGKGKNAAPVYLGVGKELKKYVKISKVSLYKNSDNEVGLLFEPKDSMEAGFDKMKVLIHKKDWWPYQIEMETPSMNSKAKFSNFSFNKGIEADVFDFKPPKDAQVVDGAVF